MPRGRKSAIVVTLTPDEYYQLMALQRSTRVHSGLARRARILLLMSEGHTITDTAALAGASRRHTYKWIQRWKTHGIAGLHDKVGRGRKGRS